MGKKTEDAKKITSTPPAQGREIFKKQKTTNFKILIDKYSFFFFTFITTGNSIYKEGIAN